MQRLEGERRVPDPGVAVVPVALPARRLGQRRRQRRDRRPRRHVRQPLDRQRRALDQRAQLVIGDPRPRQPVAPEARRRARASRWPPRRWSAPALSRPTRARSTAPPLHGARAARARDGPRSRSACRSEAASSARRRSRRRDGDPRSATTPRDCGRSRTPARTPARPRRCRRCTLTVRTSMCSASSSAGGRVCGVIVSSPSARAHRQRVAHDRPPRRRLPCRHQRVGPRLIGPAAGHVDPERAETERAGATVQQRPEHARRVKPRDAQPVDRPVGRHQRARMTVRQERVVGDRRERRRRRGALRHRRAPLGAPRSAGRRRASWPLFLLPCVAGLMTPPTGGASAHNRPGPCPPPQAPTTPSRTDAPAVDARAAAPSPASTARRRLGG